VRIEKVGDQFAKFVLDSLSAHMAILDQNGVILTTNKAWKTFATGNEIQTRPDTIGVNYLDICNTAMRGSAEEAGGVYKGITNLIAGRIDEFVIDYPCHSPDEKRWFYMRATRLEIHEEMLVVISHENITPLKLAEEKLRHREEELNIRTQNLDDANTALRTLFDQRERDRKEIEKGLVSNLRELVFPYLEKLRNSKLSTRQKDWLDITTSRLEDMVSPFLQRISALEICLTPQEIRVSTLIREGRTSKEIAEILLVSMSAVDFHRKNIRKKFGLTRKKVSLCSYLL